MMIQNSNYYLEGLTLVYNKPGVNGSVSENRFPLSEVSGKDLAKLRKKCQDGFILRIGNNLYFTELPEDFRTITKIENAGNRHLCADCPCSTMAKCPKFINRSRYLEDYDFISFGFEIFSKASIKETFVVSQCELFEKRERKEREPISLERFDRAKRNIAELYFNW